MSFILFIQVPLDEPLALLLPTWLLNLQKVPLWHKTWHLALLSQLFFVQYTQSVMRHQTGDGWFVMDRKMSVIKRCPTHLYECLWWHYFKTRNIVTLLSPVYLRCLQVIVTHHKPSSLLTPCYRLGVLDMHTTLRLRRLTCECGESGTWTSTALKSTNFSLKKIISGNLPLNRR